MAYPAERFTARSSSVALCSDGVAACSGARVSVILVVVDFESGAGLLHRLTSVDAERGWDVLADDPRLRHDLEYNTVETLSPQVKEYGGGLRVLALPRELPRPDVSVCAALAGLPVAGQPLDADQLARILFLGAGVVRTAERAGRTWLFRAAGSAGARFPLEVYVSTKGVAGVADGVHWYDPRGSAKS